ASCSSVTLALSLHDALPIYLGVEVRARAQPVRDARAALVERVQERVRALADRGHGPPAGDDDVVGDHQADTPSCSAAIDWMSLTDRKSTRLNSSHLGISYAV